MTTSRIVRGTKARIFLYVCGVLIITGIIACYNNTLSQLDDVKKTYELCHQEQENLSTQLQMISDYKQRLEKSLKTEKAEHQQSLNELRSKVNEEQTKNEKSSLDAKMKFSSLQQHYKLLQTQHDDLREKCSDIQQQQLSEINNLQSKLKEVQEHSKQVQSKHESLKGEYLQLEETRKNLEQQIRDTSNNHVQNINEINRITKINHDLQRELEALKSKCPAAARDLETFQAQHLIQAAKSVPSKSTQSSLNFTKQVPIDNNSYQIRDAKNKPVDTNVADQPPAGENKPRNLPLNSENVLALPNNNQVVSSPSSVKVSKASLDGVQPLKIPTVTPESVKNKVSKELKANNERYVLPIPYQKLPNGVVPVPETQLSAIKKPEVEDKSVIANEINEALPNRYRNNIIDNELERDEQNQLLKNNVKGEDIDKENVANEVFDAPVHSNNNNDKVNYDALGFGDDPIKHAEKLKFDKHHIDALGVGDEKLNLGHGPKLYDGQNEADYDKVAQNDVQMEENDPEEDDDVDDYGDKDNIARQKDPAVRN